MAMPSTCTRALGAAGRDREFEHVGIEQRGIVVVLDIVDRLAPLARIASWLAVVVDRVERHRAVVRSHQAVAADRSRQPHADHIRRMHQVGPRTVARCSVGVVHQPVDVALVPDHVDARITSDGHGYRRNSVKKIM
jgi:hypothetical protein